MPTHEEARRQQDAVERAMLEHGWSPRIARALAERLGVSKRTVYRIKARVEADIREGLGSRDRETEHADFLMRLRQHQAAARNAMAFGPLSSMMGVESRVLGLDGTTVKVSTSRLTDAERAEAIEAMRELAGSLPDAE
jgi:transposase